MIYIVQHLHNFNIFISEGGHKSGWQCKSWSGNIKEWMDMTMPELLKATTNRSFWKRLSVFFSVLRCPLDYWSSQRDCLWCFGMQAGSNLKKSRNHCTKLGQLLERDKANKRNNRWFCTDLSEVPTVRHTKFYDGPGYYEEWRPKLQGNIITYIDVLGIVMKLRIMVVTVCP